jgi:hypothetical protein
MGKSWFSFLVDGKFVGGRRRLNGNLQPRGRPDTGEGKAGTLEFHNSKHGRFVERRRGNCDGMGYLGAVGE